MWREIAYYLGYQRLSLNNSHRSVCLSHVLESGAIERFNVQIALGSQTLDETPDIRGEENESLSYVPM
jgi:hypothetical protein